MKKEQYTYKINQLRNLTRSKYQYKSKKNLERPKFKGFFRVDAPHKPNTRVIKKKKHKFYANEYGTLVIIYKI